MLSHSLRYTIVALSVIVMFAAFMMGGAADPTHAPSERSMSETGFDDAAASAARDSGMRRFLSENEAYETLAFESPELESLRNADLNLSDAFTSVFEMRIPVSPVDPGQGVMARECRLTYDRGEIGLTLQLIDEPALTYQTMAEGNGYQALDYDDDGNLLVWLSVRKDCLFGRDINRAIDEQVLYRVSPNNSVSVDHTYIQVYEYAIGSTDNAYEFEQFRFATGHGVSRHLRALAVAPTAVGERTNQLSAHGVFGEGGLSGIWDLTVENTDESQLVREAAFYASAMIEAPTVHVESFGAKVETDGGVISNAGTIEYMQIPGRTFVVSVEVVEYSDIADSAHLAELRDRVTTGIPIGAEVVDFSVPITQRYTYDGTNLD